MLECLYSGWSYIPQWPQYYTLCSHFYNLMQSNPINLMGFIILVPYVIKYEMFTTNLILTLYGRKYKQFYAIVTHNK